LFNSFEAKAERLRAESAQKNADRGQRFVIY
jgi:hypothetical protein